MISTGALAAPATVAHQGRVFDSTGVPVEGEQSVTFTLYSASAAGSSLWSETIPVTFEDGYFATALGGSSAISDAILANPSLWLSVQIGSAPELSPRLAVNSVPYALSARSVSGGVVDATEVQVNGTTVIDADGSIDWSALAGLPDGIAAAATGQTLASLACGAGQFAIYDGTAWDCGDVNISSLPASVITSGQLDINRIPVGTTSGTVAAGDHTHDGVYAAVGSVYTKAETDAAIEGKVFDPTSAKAVPKAWTVSGRTNACRAAASGWVTVPEMTRTFTLDGDYTIVTMFDYNYHMNIGTGWVGTRLNLNGTPDQQYTHTNPSIAGEDSHVSLFRIDELGAGQHTIRAEWGEGSGTACNSAADDASNNHDGDSIWTRRLTVYAIPKETGVKSAMVWGTNEDACRPGAANWATMPQMTSNIALTEPSVVLSFFNFNGVGPTSAWTAARIQMNSDNNGGTNQHPQGSADEDAHYSIFQLDSLNAGNHVVKGQWGHGSGTICNNAADGRRLWGRRLGWVAIPVSSGVQAWGADPRTDYNQNNASWVGMPGLSYEAWVPPGPSMLALTAGHVTVNPDVAGNWAAFRFNVDGNGDLNATHVQPSTAGEDTITQAHRVDVFGPGAHTLRGQWFTSGGVTNNAGNTSYAPYIWSRRMATIALPIQSYAE